MSKLKELHEATLRKEYLSESELSKYLYARAAAIIELQEAALGHQDFCHKNIDECKTCAALAKLEE